MEKNLLLSAYEEALKLNHQLLVLSEQSQKLVHQLEMFIDYGDQLTMPEVSRMPECIKRIPHTYQYVMKDLWKMLERARKAGILDVDYQPLCSWPDASILANLIGIKLHVHDKWKLFSYIWGVHNITLSKKFQGALNTKKFAETERHINDILNAAV